MATKKKITTKQLINKLSSNKTPTPAIPFPETRILFKELPNDRILVTGFENFLTVSQIKEKYGEIVTAAYFQGIAVVRLEGDSDQLIISRHQLIISRPGDALAVKQGWNNTAISINSNFDKKQFGEIIATIKKCVNMLHQIIIAVNGPVKSIKI